MWDKKMGGLTTTRAYVIIPRVSDIASIAQAAERILGKDEVTGSNPVRSSRELDCL